MPKARDQIGAMRQAVTIVLSEADASGQTFRGGRDYVALLALNIALTCAVFDVDELVDLVRSELRIGEAVERFKDKKRGVSRRQL